MWPKGARLSVALILAAVLVAHSAVAQAPKPDAQAVRVVSAQSSEQRLSTVLLAGNSAPARVHPLSEPMLSPLSRTLFLPLSLSLHTQLEDARASAYKEGAQAGKQ